jgi:hypothetical protein
MKQGCGCFLILLGLAWEGLAWWGLRLAGYQVADEWCLLGFAATFFGGVLLGYGLIRKKKQ